jgi:hypothetical protein
MILDLAWGDPAPSTEPPLQESGLLLAGPAALGALAVLLGVYLPGPLQAALRQAASALGGAAP